MATCHDLLGSVLTPRQACQVLAEYSRALDTRLECLDPFVYADSSLDDSEAFSEAKLSELHASILDEPQRFR